MNPVSVSRKSPRPLRWLITAGPTQEPIDPVRFLSNASSGRLGVALALAAHARGHAVTLVCGPVAIPLPSRAVRLCVHSVRTAREMLALCQQYARRADVIVMTAAVADYRPARVAAQKIKKSMSQLTLRLVRNPDILAILARQRRAAQCLVGFALETRDLEKNAQEKLARKKLDVIVANTPAAISAAAQHMTLYWADGRKDAWPVLAKTVLARRLVRVLEARRVRAANPVTQRA